MPALKVMDDIYYVGVQNQSLRVFDIIMYTEHGTSYNSYIAKGKDKIAIFETVKEKFFDEHLEKIREVCDPAKIDYIVANHTEPDHSGSIAKLLDYAPNAEVLGTVSAIKFLKEILNRPFKHRIVSEKDEIDLGGMTLRFLVVPLLHWPDSMYTYIPEKKALFTCDSFGCHYADDRVFNDLIEGDFTDAYKYYFDNIIGPFKRPYMTNALKKIEGLDIAFIGNGHGPVLRTNLDHYINLYKQWCEPPKKERKDVVIAYVSAYGYTKELAAKIAEGITQASDFDVKMFDLVHDDKEKAAQAIAEADGFLLGSPTLVGDALPPIWEMLLGLNPIIHKGKFASAFGSYGWSGEAVPNLISRMKQLKLNVVLDGLKINFKPSEEQLLEAEEFGRAFANAMQ